jgi:MurNAc alpha-1-phosphate uridylyltransferase
MQMKAIILAAGRGERMRPLTDTMPKPLLRVRGRPLLEWHVMALAQAGVQEVVINTAWLEEQIPAALGDGARWGLRIHYSMEGRDHGGALETAGGIRKALPLLGDAFWVVSGDVFVPGFVFAAAQAEQFAASGLLAHLWLVPNPPYHPKGDFGLSPSPWGLGHKLLGGPDAQGRIYTYANLAMCHSSLCEGLPMGERRPLGPLLFEGARQARISAQLWTGEWANVGTPEQLAALQGP